MTSKVTIRRGLRKQFLMRYRPGGSEQPIAASTTVRLKISAERTKSPVVTLTSQPTAPDDAEIEKLAVEAQASVAVTSFSATGTTYVIEAATATFVTNRVEPGNEVVVTGDQAGTYTVVERLSETKVRVLEQVTADAAPSATLVVNRGDGWLLMKVDQADAAKLLFSTGVGVLSIALSGQEPEYAGEICVEVEEAAQ